MIRESMKPDDNIIEHLVMNFQALMDVPVRMA